MRKSLHEAAEKLDDFNQKYEKDVTNNILKQLNVKETFKDVNFGDPLADPSNDLSVKEEDGG